jgi:hypothetical protein
MLWRTRALPTRSTRARASALRDRPPIWAAISGALFTPRAISSSGFSATRCFSPVIGFSLVLPKYVTSETMATMRAMSKRTMAPY